MTGGGIPENADAKLSAVLIMPQSVTPPIFCCDSPVAPVNASAQLIRGKRSLSECGRLCAAG